MSSISSDNTLNAGIGEEKGRWVNRALRRWERLLTPIDLDPSEFPLFEVEAVHSPAQWHDVIALRSRRYKALPVSVIDAEDLLPSAKTLLVRDASSKVVVGTCRILFGPPVSVSQFVELPRKWTLRKDGTPCLLAEVRKLAVYSGTRVGQAATKLVLWSQILAASEQYGAEWIIASAREPLAADYRLLLCERGNPPILFKPPDVPEVHEVYAQEVSTARARLRDSGSPHLAYIAGSEPIQWSNYVFSPIPSNILTPAYWS